MLQKWLGEVMIGQKLLPLHTAAFLLVSAASVPNVIAGEYTFCLMVNRVASEASLRQYSDHQVQNGLCMTTKELLDGITSGDRLKETVCMEASEHMMREFQRRFPGRSSHSVIGRC